MTAERGAVVRTLLAIDPTHSIDNDAPLALDSLGFVELMVKLEEGIDGADLLGNEDVIAEGGPLETVGSLVAYLERDDG